MGLIDAAAVLFIPCTQNTRLCTVGGRRLQITMQKINYSKEQKAMKQGYSHASLQADAGDGGTPEVSYSRYQNESAVKKERSTIKMGAHLRSKTLTLPSAATVANTPQPPQAMSYTSLSCAMSCVSTSPLCENAAITMRMEQAFEGSRTAGTTHPTMNAAISRAQSKINDHNNRYKQ
eukprot:1146656-Pelagomonas_calceolata.AAC.2